MPEYKWPAMSARKVMGKRHSRIDGIEKASGKAKYTSDYHKPGMLHAAFTVCPYAHAKVTSIDASSASKMPGDRKSVV